MLIEAPRCLGKHVPPAPLYVDNLLHHNLKSFSNTYILVFFWVLHPISMSVCVPPNKPTGNAVTPAGGPTVPLGSGTVTQRQHQTLQERTAPSTFQVITPETFARCILVQKVKFLHRTSQNSSILSSE